MKALRKLLSVIPWTITRKKDEFSSDNKTRRYAKLSPERKEEIFWLLAKRKLAKSGIRLDGSMNRETGNLAQKFGVSMEELVLFFQEAYAQLHNESFPEFMVWVNFSASDATEAYLRGNRAKIATAYVMEDVNRFPDKERIQKIIPNLCRTIPVEEEELWSLYAEVSSSLYYHKIVLPKMQRNER
ncbi:MAG: hypothetical protein PHT44_01260 [Candidatus Portnoybacteria bacterium]|nr:hypothetical protein [Candidatus Portnoybacteria bacterium]MDD4982770.1 hypothetical protein [Candidatus Portnoybacteria bacterium]